MRILIVSDEIWNDRVFGNNVLQNWFEGMDDAEFAQVCATPGKPLNKMCQKYFQVTDMMMLKSIFGRRAGQTFEMSPEEMLRDPQVRSYISESGFYRFMKGISGTSVRLAREILWSIGRYDKIALKKFISDFKPDVVFCPRRSTWKSVRLEKTVSRITSAPMIAFTGDDEASLREYNLSPLYWLNRCLFRLKFANHVKLFKMYFNGSKLQAEEYHTQYGIDTAELYKCGQFTNKFTQKQIEKPIRLIYAGRLYCNRWKTLAAIGHALKIINRDSTKFILDVYTQENLTTRQSQALCKENYIYLHGAVTPDELKQIYQQGDIALHVESMDLKNRLLTRVSFSTKIVDLMSSTCAIMAICWKEHAGYKYLQENDAAFCLSNYDEILPQLEQIARTPSLINSYALKAYLCGIKNHQKNHIQAQLRETFERVASIGQ